MRCDLSATIKITFKYKRIWRVLLKLYLDRNYCLPVGASKNGQNEIKKTSKASKRGTEQWAISKNME